MHAVLRGGHHDVGDPAGGTGGVVQRIAQMALPEFDCRPACRADEQRRAAEIPIDRLPLVTAGVTSKIVGDFWQAHAFDLELPNMNGKTMHGNCDLCCLKGGQQVQALIAEKPERALWWAKIETMVQSSGQATGQGDRFRKDRPSYQKMYEYALAQNDWIGHATSDETIPCFCGD